MLMGTFTTYPKDHDSALLQATSGLFPAPSCLMVDLYTVPPTETEAESQGRRLLLPLTHHTNTWRNKGLQPFCGAVLNTCIPGAGNGQGAPPCWAPSNMPWHWESGAGHARLHAHTLSPAVGSRQQWSAAREWRGERLARPQGCEWPRISPGDMRQGEVELLPSQARGCFTLLSGSTHTNPKVNLLRISGQ